MKFTSVAFPAILLAMATQAHASCHNGETPQCTVNGKPGIAQCDPETHMFGPCSGEVSAQITIDWNDTQQTIDGFGTSEDSSAPALYAWNKQQREQILDLAFSQEKGIGLTIFRSQIGPELHPDKDTWNYSDTAQVWVMTEAVKRGVTKLFGSVFSPPAWMKTNGFETNCVNVLDDQGKTIPGSDGKPIFGCCLNDNHIPILDGNGQPIQPPHCPVGALPEGALKLENYQDFAGILSHYAGEYARQNHLNIYAVSIQNEPDNSETWRSCRWTGAQIASFLADFLSPTFAANHIAAKVIAPETSQWDESEKDSEGNPYMEATYNIPKATARLDIAAAHLYGGDPSMIFQNARAHKKKIWQTEASLSFNVWREDDGTHTDALIQLSNALSWATLIHQSLTHAEVNAWLWYIMAAEHVPEYKPESKWPGMLISLELEDPPRLW